MSRSYRHCRSDTNPLGGGATRGEEHFTVLPPREVLHQRLQAAIEAAQLRFLPETE
jgi:hypothetical protein